MMGDSYRKMKRENEVLVSENAHLKNWVGILTKNIQLLEKEIDAVKDTPNIKKYIDVAGAKVLLHQSNLKNNSRGSHHFFDVPASEIPKGSYDESFEAFNTKKLFFASKKKKGVVEPSTNFSSRFMPNVKFVISMEQYKTLFPEHQEVLLIYSDCDLLYAETDKDGEGFSLYKLKPLGFNRVVSIYEAVPELVPDGMVYDKESDSLKHSFVSMSERPLPVFDEMDMLRNHPHTKFMEERRKVLFKFAESLNHATGFTFEECLDVIRDYGGQNARAVLDLMASGIDPSAFKLEK